MGDFTSHGQAWTPAQYRAACEAGKAGPRPAINLRRATPFIPPKPKPGTGRISGAAQRKAKGAGDVRD